MNQLTALRHLRIAIFLVLSVLALGIVGYMLIEHYSFLDALFTTVDMMSTVGITLHPLSEFGRLFTIAIIILGVGSRFYTFGTFLEFMIEGHLSRAVGRRIMYSKTGSLRKHCFISGFGPARSRVDEEFATSGTSCVLSA